ncbi:MAG: hypothetical protein ACE37F_11510 [Nannocystaceae bacterium]|nr:hypothetical protein [bacterium]
MSLATAFLATLLFAPPPETPDPDPWFWNAPAHCPASEDVRAEVERHLGSAITELPLQSWAVVGTVTYDAEAGFAAAIVIETPDGRHDRLLRDPADCGTLSESAALLIALALGPGGTDALEPEPQPPLTPQRPTTPAPAPTPPPPQPEQLPAAPALDAIPEEPPPPPLTFAIGLTPGFDYGTLRGVSPTGRLALAWQPKRLRVGVAARFGGTPAFSLPPLEVRPRLWLWTLATEAGPVPSLGRFEFPLMLGIEAGQIVLTPRALLPDASQLGWAALLLTPGVSWVPRPWLAVTARLGTTVALVGRSFTIPGFDPLLVTSRLGVRASMGLEFRVPLAMKTAAAGN